MNEKPLPDSAFIVLAVIAEGETHGYDLQRTVHNRGFQFWTDLKRSSSYNALVLLEARGLVRPKSSQGGGPERKVYSITETGKKLLALEGFRHLSAPEHPKSEIDLGIYVLPFLPKKTTREALTTCIANMEKRLEFLEERLNWCRSKNLQLPALAFERPFLLLKAEVEWLKKVQRKFEVHSHFKIEDWQRYEFREPPHRKKGRDNATQSPTAG